MILTLRPEYDPGRVHATQHKITVDPKSIDTNTREHAHDRSHCPRHPQHAANAPNTSIGVQKTSKCGPESDLRVSTNKKP